MKKVILITGASSGIGKATALDLINEGHTVYGLARRVDQMQDLVQKGGKALALDITDDEAIVQVVESILGSENKIDVLVNNAGYAVYGSVEDTPIQDARNQFNVNLFGLARLTQEIIPHMRKNNSGQIINISSIGGKIYTPLGAWYHARKHALEGWSDCLRLELDQFGIDVVIIEPGLIKTEFGDVMYDPMLKRAKGGAYEEFAGIIAKATSDSYAKDGAASPPSVIGKTIAKAVRSKKPKTRYAAGKMATMLLSMRKWTSDRLFDKMVMSQVKGIGK